MSFTIRRRVVGAVLLVSATSIPSVVAEISAKAALEGLQSWLDGTRQLESRFEQELLSGALGAGLAERGTLYVSRPGRMRWDYKDPEVKIALIDQGRMRLYLAEDRQLIVSEIPEEGDLLPTLLTGTGRLATLFEPEIVEESAGERTVLLRLVPRDRVDSFEEVLLSLRAKTWEIDRALVMDAAGNRMEYRFSRLRRNRPIAEEVFSFDPPPGTEIIDQP